MYYFSQPPFLVSIIGVAIALAFISSFKAQVEQQLQNRSQEAKKSDFYQLKGKGLVLSYWGVCLGVWIFLAGGLLIFDFGIISAYGVSLLLTIFIGSLIWTQLNDLLMQFYREGSKALNLDEMNK
ncbi:hypothetical protein [Myxosarcina sp. GI1(2024)]